jgi:hypothetical protein
MGGEVQRFHLRQPDQTLFRHHFPSPVLGVHPPHHFFCFLQPFTLFPSISPVCLFIPDYRLIPPSLPAPSPSEQLSYPSCLLSLQINKWPSPPHSRSSLRIYSPRLQNMSRKNRRLECRSSSLSFVRCREWRRE